MKKAEINVKQYKYIAIGTLCGAVVTVIFLLILAAVFTAMDLDSGYAHPLASIACAIGSFITGLISAKLCKSKGLINGMVSGLILYIIIMIISLIISDSSVTLMSLIRLIIMLTASGIGGILGVNKRNKKHLI